MAGQLKFMSLSLFDLLMAPITFITKVMEKERGSSSCGGHLHKINFLGWQKFPGYIHERKLNPSFYLMPFDVEGLRPDTTTRFTCD